MNDWADFCDVQTRIRMIGIENTYKRIVEAIAHIEGAQTAYTWFLISDPIRDTVYNGVKQLIREDLYELP